MKTAYICSPYRGKTEQEETEHVAYAVELMEYVLASGQVAPIVPHLYFPMVLDDDLQGDREIAQKCGAHLLEGCDMMICGMKYGMSEGMSEEIQIALEENIPILWINAKPSHLIGIIDAQTAAEEARSLHASIKAIYGEKDPEEGKNKSS